METPHRFLIITALHATPYYLCKVSVLLRTCSGLGLGDAGAIVLAYLLRGSLPQTVTHVHVRDNRIGACTHPGTPA